MATSDLISELYTISEGPWSNLYHGRGLDDRGLAKLLKPYGIGPKRIRIGDDTFRGYDFGDFHDPWSRYLSTPVSPESATSATDATEMEAPVPQREQDGTMTKKQLMKEFKEYISGRKPQWDNRVKEFSRIPEEERTAIYYEEQKEG